MRLSTAIWGTQAIEEVKRMALINLHAVLPFRPGGVQDHITAIEGSRTGAGDGTAP